MLAKLHLPQTFAHSCLFKANSMIKSFSDKIDFLHFKQQVLDAFEWPTQEKEVYFEISTLVPQKSEFFRKSVVVHIQSILKNLECDLLHMWYLRNRLPTNDVDFEQRQIDTFDKGYEKKYEEFAQFLYGLLASPSVHINSKKLYKDYLIVNELFWIVSLELHWNTSQPSKKEKIDANFQDTNHHLASFVAFWNDSILFHQYEKDLQDLKLKFQKQTRLVNNLLWADVGFSHLLLLKLTHTFAPVQFIQELYNDIYRIYLIYEHPKANLMKKKMIDCQPYNWPSEVSSANECVSFSWIIKNAPRVKNLIRLGVSSVERFDVKDQSSYWEVEY